MMRLALAFASFRWPQVEADPAAAQALVAALRTDGFAYISDHGVPAAALAAALEEGRGFFAEAEEAKRGFLTPPGKNLKCGRGYIPVHGEALDAEGPPDPKEVLDVGLPLTPVHAAHLGATPWPEQVENATRALLEPMADLSRRVLKMLGAELGAPLKAFEEPLFVARYTHYLPTNAADLGCGSHFDFGALTWVYQEEQAEERPGLQVMRSDGDAAVRGTFMQNLEHRYGDWQDVRPREGTLVLQLGEALARVSGGRLPASRHRVVASDRSRHSLSFFVDPHPDATLEPLEGLQGPQAFAPMLAGHKGVLLLSQLASRVV